jgi:hypothetical protein
MCSTYVHTTVAQATTPVSIIKNSLRHTLHMTGQPKQMHRTTQNHQLTRSSIAQITPSARYQNGRTKQLTNLLLGPERATAHVGPGQVVRYSCLRIVRIGGGTVRIHAGLVEPTVSFVATEAELQVINSLDNICCHRHVCTSSKLSSFVLPVCTPTTEYALKFTAVLPCMYIKDIATQQPARATAL